VSQKGKLGNSSDAHCGLERITQFRSLPEETRRHLRNICTVHRLAAGDTLAREGDKVRRVYFVRRGLLRMQKHLADGRIQIVGLLPQEHMVGTVFVEEHVFAIEAAIASEVISFEARPFKSAVRTTPELEQILFRSFQDEVDSALSWLLVLSHTKVRQRLSGFFMTLLSNRHKSLNLKDYRQNTLSLKIPLSRADVSNLLGVRQESLSRAFHALADDGLIEIVRHNHVRIVDIDGLMMEVGDPELFGSELDDRAGIGGKRSL
jgi:CRP/FNR family transcriptional regulator